MKYVICILFLLSCDTPEVSFREAPKKTRRLTVEVKSENGVHFVSGRFSGENGGWGVGGLENSPVAACGVAEEFLRAMCADLGEP